MSTRLTMSALHQGEYPKLQLKINSLTADIKQHLEKDTAILGLKFKASEITFSAGQKLQKQANTRRLENIDSRMHWSNNTAKYELNYSFGCKLKLHNFCCSCYLTHISEATNILALTNHQLLSQPE